MATGNGQDNGESVSIFLVPGFLRGNPHDAAFLQFAVCVALLLVLDLLGILGGAYQSYTYFVTQWENTAYLEAGMSPWGFDINPAIVGVSAFIVQTCTLSSFAALPPADETLVAVYACEYRPNLHCADD